MGTATRIAISAKPANPVTQMNGRRLVQRKCACGGTPGPSGECETCRKKRQGVLQRQTAGFANTRARQFSGPFRIDRPDSFLEREADQIADRVMSDQATGSISSATQSLQREEAGIIPAQPLQIGVPKGALERKLPERQPGTPRGTFQIPDPVADPCLKGARCQLAISGSNMDYHLDAANKESRQRETLQKEGKSVALVPAPEMTKFLKDQTPAASSSLREVMVDPAMGTGAGAWRVPCPDDASASCVTVAAHWEEQASLFNTKADQQEIGGQPRAEWRFMTRQMLTHEAAHARFTSRPPPGMPKFDGNVTRATISHKELSELFAQLAEFPIFYEEAMSGDAPEREKLRKARDSYSDRYLQRTMEITEDIPGILTRLRCLNPCGELDTMLKSLFTSVTAGWPAPVRQALLTILTDPAVDLHWPAPPQPKWNLTPEPEGLRFEKNPLQRKPVSGGLEWEETAFESVGATLRESGQPLDGATRQFMESRFGHDFSQVRVHANAQAAESAQAVDAHAYTVGRDIVFAHGQYMPHSDSGRQLLSHELAHVVQQNGASRTGKFEIAPPNHPLENEADRAASSVMSANESGTDSSGYGSIPRNHATSAKLFRKVVASKVHCTAGTHGAPADPVAELTAAETRSKGLAEASAILATLEGAATTMGLTRSPSATRLAYEARFGLPPRVRGGFRNRLSGRTAPTQDEAIQGELERLGDRLQRIADNYDRDIHYKCIGGTTTFMGCEGHCRGRDATACDGIRAIMVCSGFWNASEAGRATLLIHESAHMLWANVMHGANFRHASCYANFVADIFSAPTTGPACPAP